jgi:four helix bundle protein
MFMSKGAILTKSKDFAVRIIKLTRYLQDDKHEYVLSKQIMRSGTSIGANARESNNAQSKADFLSKSSLALKEADETQYWLELLVESEIINQSQVESLNIDLKEIIALLTASIKTTKNNINK